MFVPKLDQEFFRVICSAFNDFLTRLLLKFNNSSAMDNVRSFTVQA